MNFVPIEWTCEQVATTTQECVVTATSSVSVFPMTFNDMNLWLALFVFLLAFVPLGLAFSLFKKS